MALQTQNQQPLPDKRGAVPVRNEAVSISGQANWLANRHQLR